MIERPIHTLRLWNSVREGLAVSVGSKTYTSDKRHDPTLPQVQTIIPKENICSKSDRWS